MTSMLLRPVVDPGAFADAVSGGAVRSDRPARPTDRRSWLGSSGLVSMARGLARNVHLWPELADPSERRWELVLASEDVEAWLIAWPPGGSIDMHDHGGASGAMVVARGELVERTPVSGPQGKTIGRRTLVGTGGAVAFGAGHVHGVVNAASSPALSVHVYSPRLTEMTTYGVRGGRLESLGTTRYRAGR